MPYGSGRGVTLTFKNNRENIIRKNYARF